MIADDKSKVLVGTPTKTGTHSLEAVVRGLEKQGGQRIRLVRTEGSKIPRHHHMLVPQDCKSYLKLLTVRHPLDRLASLYFWLLKYPWQWKSEADGFIGLSMDQFARWWWAYRVDEVGLDFTVQDQMQAFNWWRSPNIWVVSLSECYDMLGATDTIRLEQIEEDIYKIRSNWPRIANANRSRPIGDGWRKHYRISTMRYLGDRLGPDLERFEYDI